MNLPKVKSCSSSKAMDESVTQIAKPSMQQAPIANRHAIPALKK